MKMIKFNMSGGFKLMEEGEKIVTLTKVEPSPSGAPTSINVVYTDDKGATINEKIDLSKALWKISAIAGAVLNAKDGEEMEASELCKKLQGKQIKVEIVHNKGKQAREDGTFPTFANVRNILGGVESAPATTENPRSSILAGL